MDIKELDQNNIDGEHLCCAISDKKSTQIKREWLKERFSDGYRFYKIDQQGKAFIECVPAENAWAPIRADGYLFIDCFWVSGSLAKKGYGTALLERCVKEAKAARKKGLVAVCANNKKPFLSDPKFYRKHGFRTADTAAPYFELLYLPFDESAIPPSFCDSAKTGTVETKGVTIYYTDHCPWNAKYIPVLKEITKKRGAAVAFCKLATKEAAQKAPSPFTTYAVYYDGAFVTNEMMSDKKFIKFLEEKGL